MIEHLTGGKPLPEEVMAQIVAKTDGVPLFVEELTKNGAGIGPRLWKPKTAMYSPAR